MHEEDRLNPPLLIKLQASQSALHVMLVECAGLVNGLEQGITGSIENKMVDSFQYLKTVMGSAFHHLGTERNSMQVFLAFRVNSCTRLKGNEVSSE